MISLVCDAINRPATETGRGYVGHERNRDTSGRETAGAAVKASLMVATAGVAPRETKLRTTVKTRHEYSGMSMEFQLCGGLLIFPRRSTRPPGRESR